MSCNSPNKVFYTGWNSDTGKKKILFTSRSVDFIARPNSSKPWQKLVGDPASTRALGYEVVTDCDLVPCGQCLGCRLDYAREWAARMMCEAKKYDKQDLWFVTCTYDDDHLPPSNEAINYATGEMEISPFHPLSKDDHQLFMKRLRKKYGSGVRFFCSGEYGDTTYRPHFHYIFFGLHLDDLEVIGRNWRGELYYESPTLDRIWNKGFVTVGNLDFDSCEYVARYVMKKQKGEGAKVYEDLGIVPEFCVMSRKPGIGKEYFDENYEHLYQTDEIILPSSDGVFSSKVPRYYDSLLERIDPYRIAETKAQRKDRASEARRTRESLFPFIDEEDIFSARDRQLKQKATVLKKGNL